MPKLSFAESMAMQSLFVDAQQMAKEHPETFDAPAKEELAILKAGNLVKVCAGNERFWTIIQSIDGDKITARIDNDLVSTDEHGLSADDIITFEKRHIYQIWNDN